MTTPEDHQMTKTDDRIYDGDPCPRCGRALGYEDHPASMDDPQEYAEEIIHPDPQCGWQPDGYPSTREGSPS